MTTKPTRGKTMYGLTEAVYHAWLRVRGLNSP